MDRHRDPSGDYGYDLVHEETQASRLPDDAPAPEHTEHAPMRPEDLTGDYGYDEAHGF